MGRKEGSHRAMSQAAQKGGGVSLLGDLQKPRRHGGGQPALGMSLFDQGFGPGDLHRFLAMLTIL